MKQEQKLKLLQDLNHDELIGLVLIDLFDKMDFQTIRNYHGPLEEGKDLVFCNKDPIQSFEYRGAIVETSRITADLHNKRSAPAFYYQAEKALEEPFKDLKNSISFYLSKCYIITPYPVDSFAKNSIAHKFKYHSNSVIFIDAIDLIDLLDTYTPEIFSGTLSSSNRYLRHLYTSNVFVKNLKLLGANDSRKVYDLYTGGKIVPYALNVLKKPIASETQELNKICRKHPVLFLYGDPGSGKSLMLQRFILDSILDRNGKLMPDLTVVPIYVRLYLLHNYKMDSFDAFIGSVFESIKPFGYDAYSPLNANKKYVFLFDGLDEVYSDQMRKSFIQLLRHFFINDKYTAVITSRYYCESDIKKALKSPGNSKYTEFSLLPFSKLDKKNFLIKWFCGNYKEANKLANVISQNKSLSFLSQIPLMITLIAILQKENAAFVQITHPDLRKIDIYNNIVTLLLETWDKYRKLSFRYDPEDKRYLLEELAFFCQSNKKREITKKEIMEVFSEARKNTRIPQNRVEDVLFEIHERSNLLIKNENKNYEFYHLSFQEYFAASRLYRNNPPKEVLAHLKNTWWHNVLELYSGLRRDISPLYSKMWQMAKGSSTNLFLLSRCLREAKFTKHEYKKKFFRNALEEVKTINVVNEEWIQILATLEEEFWDNFELVKKAFANKPEVLFRILAVINSGRALGTLGEYQPYCTKTSSIVTKIVYVESLGQFDSSECVPHLVSFYNNLKGSLNLNNLDVLRKIVELAGRHRKLNVIKLELKNRIKELESIHGLLQEKAFRDKPRELLPKFSQLARVSPKSFLRNMNEIVTKVDDVEMWMQIAQKVMNMHITEDGNELLKDQKHTLNSLVARVESRISSYESSKNRIKNIEREIKKLKQKTTAKNDRTGRRKTALADEVDQIKRSISVINIGQLREIQADITAYITRREKEKKGSRKNGRSRKNSKINLAKR